MVKINSIRSFRVKFKTNMYPFPLLFYFLDYYIWTDMHKSLNLLWQYKEESLLGLIQFRISIYLYLRIKIVSDFMQFI